VTEQLPLWDTCDVCHRQSLGHGHRHCFEALQRWIRPDNVEQVAALLGYEARQAPAQ
jgi:hypothetical protein